MRACGCELDVYVFGHATCPLGETAETQRRRAAREWNLRSRFPARRTTRTATT